MSGNTSKPLSNRAFLIILVILALLGIGIMYYATQWGAGLLDWDILTVKYDFNGNEVWASGVIKDGGFGDDEGVGVGMDAAGDVIITGFIPADLQSATASRTSFLGGSIIPTNPKNISSFSTWSGSLRKFL